jgi:hypothetical protein
MGVILLMLAALATSSSSPGHRPVATPIGVGFGFRPAAAGAAVLHGRPFGPLSCAPAARRTRVHVELFVHGRALLLPAGIGIAEPLQRLGATVRPLGCRYPASTVDPTGVIDVTAGRVYTLADVFRIWHQPLGRRSLLGFQSRRPVRVFVNGRRWHRAPGAVPLHRHDEIVLELGRLVPPHSSYLFAEPS